MKTKRILLIDTNTLLHYRRLDQIDWLKEIGASEVEILLVPIVVRELEKQKVQHPSRKIRSRAGEYAKWINSQFSSGLETELRRGVVLRFVPQEPSLDFAACQLSKDIADDVFIAHAVEYRSDGSSDSLYIVTADTGVHLKAKGRQMGVIFWGDNDHKLPEEEDPDRKRINELEKENRELRNREPVLEVCFANVAQHHEFILLDVSSSTIEDILNWIWENNKHRRPQRRCPSSLPWEDLLRRYCEGYERYIKAIACYHRKVIRLRFALRNSGSCSAENIDIRFRFPECFKLQANYGIPSEPGVPRSASAFQRFPIEQAIPANCNEITLAEPLRDQHLYPRHTDPEVSDANHTVVYRVSEAKHNQAVILKPVFAVFEAPESADYRIECEIYASNIRSVISSALAVTVKQTNVSVLPDSVGSSG